MSTKSDAPTTLSRKHITTHLDAAVDTVLAELGAGNDPKTVERVVRALFRRGLKELAKGGSCHPVMAMALLADAHRSAVEAGEIALPTAPAVAETPEVPTESDPEDLN